MDNENIQSEKVFIRMLVGGSIGFVIGFLAGILVKPPYTGIAATSSDVQGLIYFKWLVFGGIGSVLGIIVGMLDFRKFRAKKNKR